MPKQLSLVIKRKFTAFTYVTVKILDLKLVQKFSLESPELSHIVLRKLCSRSTFKFSSRLVRGRVRVRVRVRVGVRVRVRVGVRVRVRVRVRVTELRNKSNENQIIFQCFCQLSDFARNRIFSLCFPYLYYH